MERGKGEVLELTPTTSLRNCPCEMNDVATKATKIKNLFFIALWYMIVISVSPQIYTFFQ